MARSVSRALSAANLLALLMAGCARLSDDELLAGKACSSDADCIAGYACDGAAKVCLHGVATPGEGDVTGAAGAGDGSGAGGNAGLGANGGGQGILSGGASGDSSANTGGSANVAGDGGSTANSDTCDLNCSGERACLGSVCVARWLPVAAAPSELSARSKPSFAVGNGKLFVWGGVDGAGVDLNSGAIYDLEQDTWELTAITAETPSPRTLANAAWTGSGFLVWGGRLNSGGADYRSGAVYDPTTGAWTSMPTAGNPRAASIMLSYEGQVLSWGGWNQTGAVLDRSQRYLASTNKWVASTPDLLDKREHVAWATRGSRLYVFGGRSDDGALLADGLVYDIGTTSWSGLQSLPAGRYGSFAAHDGGALFTWGGRGLDAAYADGLVMPGTLWTPITSEGAPSARWAPHRQSGWSCALAGDRVALTGGQDVSGFPQLDGAVYDRAADAWTPLPASNEAHEWGVGACIDGTLVLWGGTHDGTPSANGEKIAP